jgi:ABC-2 type transport system permease protein
MSAKSSGTLSAKVLPASGKPTRATLLTIAAFELLKRCRMLSSYVYFAVLFGCGLLSILAAGGAFASVSVGMGSDKVHANAPEVLDGFLGVLSHFGLLITAAVFGQAVQQDVETGAAPLIYSTGIGKQTYLAGRFLGAFVFSTISFSAIGIGLWVGSLMPSLDPLLFGPNRLAYYVWPYLMTVLPNVLLTGAIFFGLGALLRSMTPVYTGAVVFVIGYMMAQVAVKPENRELAALLDPLGTRATTLATRYWTVSERNEQLIPLSGVMLQNRLIWLSVSLLLLGFTFRRFAFSRAQERSRGGKKRRRPELAAPPRSPAPPVTPAPEEPTTAALPAPVAHVRVGAGELWSRLTGMYLRETLGSVYFGVIVLAGILFLGLATLQLDMLFGTPTYPVTRSLVEVVGGSFELFVLIILAFYAGELTFRERDARMDAVTDALPIPTWLPFFAKLACLLSVPVLLQLVLLVACTLIQTLQGYHHYELGLYLKALFGLQLVHYWLIGVVCFAIHAVVQHKYLGHFAVVVFYMAELFAGNLGIEHNLVLYAGAPGHPYSDMNGYGHLLRGVLWFDLYWAIGAALLVIAAYLGWQRGLETAPAARWREARARWSLSLRVATAATLAAFAATGAFIFYNTNVLETYHTQHDLEQKRADYEQRYKRFEGLAQPRVTDVKLEADVFPQGSPPQLRVGGKYELRNQTSERISTVLVNLAPDFPYTDLRIAGMGQPSQRDDRLGVYTFELDPPLQPGARTAMEFDIWYRSAGFTNDTPWTQVANNGTFFRSDNLPGLGYRDDRELSLDNERKKYGLAPKPGLADPSDLLARRNTYVAPDADWVSFEATLGTSEDQIALAPGYLQDEWTSGGRRHFRYVMDSPILHLFGVQSARYEVRRDQWRDVALEIYYHPGHEYNLDRMLQSMKDTLEYCTSQFGPYQHRQLRILEFPGYERFAQSLPNTIPYSETIGFVAKVDPNDPEDIDYPYYVTAHEVAHQWWAHQVIGGKVQGATMLSESMSQYTALMVMQRAFGPQKMKRYLRYELERYLRGRGQERKKEVPLARVEDQSYIYYQKGSLAMYALADYIGEDAVNRAAKNFVSAVKFQGPPYTTSLELLGFIRQQTPPWLGYVVDDLFENITLFRNRVNSATYRRLPDGRYALKLAVTVKKAYADDLGNETEQPLADLIEVGVVDEDGVAVQLEKRWFDATTSELTLLLDAAPIQAGIDPLNKLVDRNPDDNVMRAVEETGVAALP